MIDYIAIYYKSDGTIIQINDSFFDPQWGNRNSPALTRKEVSYTDFSDLCDDILKTFTQEDDNGLPKYYINASGNIMERENWVESEENYRNG